MIVSTPLLSINLKAFYNRIPNFRFLSEAILKNEGCSNFYTSCKYKANVSPYSATMIITRFTYVTSLNFILHIWSIKTKMIQSIIDSVEYYTFDKNIKIMKDTQ